MGYVYAFFMNIYNFDNLNYLSRTQSYNEQLA